MTQEADLINWLSDAEINTDRNLRVQYLAGMGGLNLQSDRTPDEALRESRLLPPRLFAGSPQSMEALRSAIENRGPRSRARMNQD